MAPIETNTATRERAVIILSKAIKLLSGSIDQENPIDADCSADSISDLSELQRLFVKH